MGCLDARGTTSSAIFDSFEACDVYVVSSQSRGKMDDNDNNGDDENEGYRDITRVCAGGILGWQRRGAGCVRVCVDGTTTTCDDGSRDSQALLEVRQPDGTIVASLVGGPTTAAAPAPAPTTQVFSIHVTTSHFTDVSTSTPTPSTFTTLPSSSAVVSPSTSPSLSASTSTPSSSSTGPASTSTGTPSQFNDAPSLDSSGLSTGATVALGVGLPVGVLILAVVAFFVFRKQTQGIFRHSIREKLSPFSYPPTDNARSSYQPSRTTRDSTMTAMDDPAKYADAEGLKPPETTAPAYPQFVAELDANPIDRSCNTPELHDTSSAAQLSVSELNGSPVPSPAPTPIARQGSVHIAHMVSVRSPTQSSRRFRTSIPEEYFAQIRSGLQRAASRSSRGTASRGQTPDRGRTPTPSELDAGTFASRDFGLRTPPPQRTQQQAASPQPSFDSPSPARTSTLPPRLPPLQLSTRPPAPPPISQQDEIEMSAMSYDSRRTLPSQYQIQQQQQRNDRDSTQTYTSTERPGSPEDTITTSSRPESGETFVLMNQSPRPDSRQTYQSLGPVREEGSK